jgi:hypothetical protein
MKMSKILKGLGSAPRLVTSPFFTGIMERWNKGMLAQKPAKEPMFIKSKRHADEPVIPAVSDANEAQWRTHLMGKCLVCQNKLCENGPPKKRRGSKDDTLSDYW